MASIARDARPITSSKVELVSPVQEIRLIPLDLPPLHAWRVIPAAWTAPPRILTSASPVPPTPTYTLQPILWPACLASTINTTRQTIPTPPARTALSNATLAPLMVWFAEAAPRTLTSFTEIAFNVLAIQSTVLIHPTLNVHSALLTATLAPPTVMAMSQSVKLVQSITT